MTIKWDAEHPDSNTCVEQWHYNVDFLLNNDRCSSDDFLNRDDGSIDMIVYKVEGPRSNFGGISSISSMGNPKDFEWLRNRTKPTARQISISKSLTESMVKTESMLDWPLYTPSPTENASIKWPVQVKRLKKTESMLDWPLYTPSPNRECLYKVASPGKTPEKTESMLDWPLYTPSPNRECLYKVASPGKTPEKTESMLDWPLYTPSPNRECLYKVASPGQTPEKQNLCWAGHFIPPPPTENASIKLPVQVKPLKKHIFTWDGHFIPQPVGSRTSTWKRKDWQQGKGGKLQRRGTTGRLQQENETCHIYIRLLFSMCHIDWRWLVYWICCI